MSYIERPRFSCALGGALETITSLPGAVPIIHAASGCGGNLFGSQQLGGLYGAGYCGGLAMPSSNVSENEIIFGGEERLKEQITKTLELIEGEIFIVVTGCMTEIIGDDPNTVLNQLDQSDKPVLAVNTGGFKGNSYHGYDLVLEALFKKYVPVSPVKEKNLVNIWGLVPGQDPFFRGDLEEIKRLLALLGIKTNTFFGYDEAHENLRQAGRASANIVLSKVYGIEAAAAFEEKHGTPFTAEYLPVGAAASAEFLYRIAGFLGIDRRLAERVVDEEKKTYYAYIERVADVYLDSDLQHYAIVAANANYSYPVTRFLSEDIGWIPELSVITDSLTDAQKEVLENSYEGLNHFSGQLVFEKDTSEIQRHFSVHRKLYSDERYFHNLSPLFILGSSFETALADDLKAKSLSISFPVLNRAVLDKGYAGFRGGLHLFEDILNVILERR